MGVGLGDAMSVSGEAMTIARCGARLASRYGGDTLNIFDVGANIGDFLAVCRDILGDERRQYFCFEPSTVAFASLKTRVADMPDVRVVNAALADKPGEMPLFSDAPGSGLGSLSQRRLDHMGIEMIARETVKVLTLDAVADDLGLDRIHFLKLDVEGFELQCLRGAERLIAERRVDYIQFEFGGTNIDTRTYFQDFWYLLKDYSISRILRDGLVRVEQYLEIEEMFQTQNYLAELRR